MRKLILIKHSAPQVDPRIKSDLWPLSDEGRQRCTPLADKLSPHAPMAIITSIEPKASETGQLLAARLNVPCTTAPNLHEHDRSNVAHMRSADFISMVEAFFRRPDDLVLGKETATQATDRITRAINQVLSHHPDGHLAIVTHGTVLALFLARHCPGVKPFPVWRSMGLPSYAVLQLPDYALLEQVDRI